MAKAGQAPEQGLGQDLPALPWPGFLPRDVVCGGQAADEIVPDLCRPRRCKQIRRGAGKGTGEEIPSRHAHTGELSRPSNLQNALQRKLRKTPLAKSAPKPISKITGIVVAEVLRLTPARQISLTSYAADWKDCSPDRKSQGLSLIKKPDLSETVACAIGREAGCKNSAIQLSALPLRRQKRERTECAGFMILRFGVN